MHEYIILDYSNVRNKLYVMLITLINKNIYVGTK